MGFVCECTWSSPLNTNKDEINKEKCDGRTHNLCLPIMKLLGDSEAIMQPTFIPSPSPYI
jgi:hypothetical protein